MHKSSKVIITTCPSVEEINDSPEDPLKEEDPYHVDPQADTTYFFQIDEHFRNVCFQKTLSDMPGCEPRHWC